MNGEREESTMIRKEKERKETEKKKKKEGKL